MVKDCKVGVSTLGRRVASHSSPESKTPAGFMFMLARNDAEGLLIVPIRHAALPRQVHPRTGTGRNIVHLAQKCWPGISHNKARISSNHSPFRREDLPQPVGPTMRLMQSRLKTRSSSIRSRNVWREGVRVPSVVLSLDQVKEACEMPISSW
jgi:hypothetical protein